MSNAERYHFADFTLDNYRRLLRLAKRHYVFRSFTDFDRAERFVLWRHDVDYSMHRAVALARIEAEEGVRATYFLDFHSELYNLLEREVSDCVRQIASLGHAFGIHFDSHYYDVTDEARVADLLALEHRFATAVFAVPFAAFSFHNPTPFTQTCRQTHYAGLLNAGGEYFHTDVGYCSDSNGYWRFKRLEDVLTAGTDARLQVLTHPEWWQDEAMPPRRRIQRCIDGRAIRAGLRYDDALRRDGRENVDGQR